MHARVGHANEDRQVLVCFDYEGQWGMPFDVPYDLEGNTHAILDCLARHGARAIFFTVGELALEHPELVRDIADAGHEIALHGWRHEHLDRMSAADLRDFGAGLRECEDAIESLVGSRPIGFRAPYLLGPDFGRPEVYEILRSHDYRWTSNREVRHVVEVLRPDRIGTARPWHAARAHPEVLYGPSARTLLVLLNARILQKDRVGGSVLSAMRWLTDGFPPFFREGLLELPLYSPLDCDLLGFPDPGTNTTREMLDYAQFALHSSLRSAGQFTMLTFHDWLVAGGNRLSLLDQLLSSLDELYLSTTTVEKSWRDLVSMATDGSEMEPHPLTVTEYPEAEHRGGGIPAVSVVLCSHNGERRLPDALARLRSQSLAHERFEVIVVDDGSEDGTTEIARAAGVRVLRLDSNAGLAAARNAGVSAARAELVAFTDDDCEPAGDWLERLIEAFSDPEVGGVGGMSLPACDDAPMERYLTLCNPLMPLSGELLVSRSLAYRLGLYLRGIFLGHNGLEPGCALWSVVGANMAFRKRLLYELDGFDEAFRFGGEEEDLCHRATERAGGAILRYQPDAVVVHQFQPGLRDVLRRARAYGRGNARASLKHLEVRPIVYPFPLLALGTAVAGAVLRRPKLALSAAAIPVVAYPRWLTRLPGTRLGELLSYPYIQATQELYAMVGELEGLRAGYQPIPSTHLRIDRDSAESLVAS